MALAPTKQISQARKSVPSKLDKGISRLLRDSNPWPTAEEIMGWTTKSRFINPFFLPGENKSRGSKNILSQKTKKGKLSWIENEVGAKNFKLG